LPVNITIVLSDETLEEVCVRGIKELELKFAVLPVSRIEKGIALLKFVDEETGQRVAVTIEPRRTITVELFDREERLVSSYKGKVALSEDPVSY